VAVLLIYRPGSVVVTDAFFTELSAYLEVFALYKCQILVAGDFNIHVGVGMQLQVAARQQNFHQRQRFLVNSSSALLATLGRSSWDRHQSHVPWIHYQPTC